MMGMCKITLIDSMCSDSASLKLSSSKYNFEKVDLKDVLKSQSMNGNSELTNIESGDVVCISMCHEQIIQSALIAGWIRKKCRNNVLIIVLGDQSINIQHLRQFENFDVLMLENDEVSFLKLVDAWFCQKTLPKYVEDGKWAYVPNRVLNVSIG